MIFELLALGVLSALRPATSQAAVVALLRAPDARRLLLAFTLTGLIVSIAVGTLIVVAFDGAGNAFGRSSFAAAFDVLAGVAALAFAAGVKQGRVSPPHRAASKPKSPSRITTRLSHPSARTAAVAGVATHVPGLIYLVVLNAIAAEDFRGGEATLYVAVYNLLWFAIPIIALALAVFSPGTANVYLGRGAAWARENEEWLLVTSFAALGAYLVIKGVVALA
ncbi:GAP family protein [Solirubrobacter ginsenosidimutans]|uniref:GAP family protein n=1 Tax=Solirubrobacter ginsenosidimutans TaxID=490573 RepID=A0A9X3MQE5_9ACTN|nr:GAP family protein [Solirubrobacter ginsenosidimutans]MDA0160405.1 GAP family protein [Solirubrobacter ginsenosidimutans]